MLMKMVQHPHTPKSPPARVAPKRLGFGGFGWFWFARKVQQVTTFGTCGLGWGGPAVVGSAGPRFRVFSEIAKSKNQTVERRLFCVLKKRKKAENYRFENRPKMENYFFPKSLLGQKKFWTVKKIPKKIFSVFGIFSEIFCFFWTERFSTKGFSRSFKFAFLRKPKKPKITCFYTGFWRVFLFS